MRARCLALLLAFVAWFAFPGATGIAAAAESVPHCVATAPVDSPVTIERTPTRAERGDTPDSGFEGAPGCPVVGARDPGSVLASDSVGADAPVRLATRSSAQPRGPPLA